MKIIFAVFVLLICTVVAKKYNKCNYFERLYKNESLCSYDPDETLDTPQFVRKYGYPCESHTVLTDDGYLLTLHRIPGTKSGKRGGQPVFLQHGLLASSFDWVVNGNISVGFMLADLGYDVWMGNIRGNTYSKAHVTLPVDSHEFWDFSFHEMALHDIPASLKYVGDITKKSGEIIYIGHSMGTTMYFIFSSLMPEEAKSVKLMIALAPVAYMSHVKSPIRYLSPFVNQIEWIKKYFGINQFLPSNRIIKMFASQCEEYKFEKELCENIVFVICGFDLKELNQDILGVILHHTPAGASTKTILHYSHEIRNDGKFQQYDYGGDNKKHYGNDTPPNYIIEDIKSDVYLMYAENDWLASPVDVKRLGCELKNLVGSYKIKMDTFNHVDFIFGKDADKLVIKPMLKVMLNYTMN